MGQMLKNVEILVVNIMLFWIVMGTMPGIDSPNGSFGFLLAGFLFALLILALPEVLRFFRFPKNVWGKMLIGSGLTFIFLLILTNLTTQIITVSEGFVGGFDFIWFTTPVLLELPTALAAIGFVSVFLNICSIILQFLNKGRL